MSALDISQEAVTVSSPSAVSPVSSPTTQEKSVDVDVDGAPLRAALDEAKPFGLSADERSGLLIVLGVALFQEVPSNVLRGALVGAAAATALYSRWGLLGQKKA